MPRFMLPFIACILIQPTLAQAAKPHSLAHRHSTAPVRALHLDATQRIIDVLDRLEFGPRLGDVSWVRQMGLRRWIEQQLRPETIDDSAVDRQLAGLRLLNGPPEQLVVAYAVDQARFIRGVRAKGRPRRRIAALGTLPDPPPDLRPAQLALYQRAEALDLGRGDSLETLGELVDARLLRAVESKRQLQEVLVDFWTNHFNLDVKKGPVRTLKVADERDVIRPHVLGSFRDLLEASAKSPAMLFYLDNVRSTRVFTDRRGRKRGGTNENYGRELMELHTLGVDGGYTQKDVQEVARCFTGWSFDRQGQFRFNAYAHDTGQKVVLGHVIPAGGGIEDGEKVLDILASSPATAKHIAREMCVRFVSDDPPAALVRRVALVFLRTHGDLRQVTRAIVESPELLSGQYAGAKLKSPFEFAVSAVRAVGGTVTVPDGTDLPGRVRLVADGSASMRRGAYVAWMRQSLAQDIGDMGEPLYSCQPPTGYPEDSREWASAGGLMSRLNFVGALTAGRVKTASAPGPDVLAAVPGDPVHVAAWLQQTLIGLPLSQQTRRTIAGLPVSDGVADPRTVLAVALASPEFERR